ncbi:MAG: 2-C-methyl-D-erythritol 4-phosphate cytidylyltransferase [bacterium]|nr:2-C-methyl-D-erythritol 4-phosphate cytidylyltransferase [bacterium]
MTISAVIAAGGRGTRMGAGFNKVFMKLAGAEILLHTIRAFDESPFVDEIIVVTGAKDIARVRTLAEENNIKKLVCVTEGGNTRRASVYNGIIKARGDIIAVHDGARCLVSQKEIENVIKDCKKYGAAAVGVICKDTLKTADNNGFITGTVDRSRTYQIQTPQVFKREILLDAHEAAVKDGFEPTDDCALAERMGIKIKITPGSYDNIKITTPEDIPVAERILYRRKD